MTRFRKTEIPNSCRNLYTVPISSSWLLYVGVPFPYRVCFYWIRIEYVFFTFYFFVFPNVFLDIMKAHKITLFMIRFYNTGTSSSISNWHNAFSSSFPLTLSVHLSTEPDIIKVHMVTLFMTRFSNTERSSPFSKSSKRLKNVMPFYWWVYSWLLRVWVCFSYRAWYYESTQGHPISTTSGPGPSLLVKEGVPSSADLINKFWQTVFVHLTYIVICQHWNTQCL